MANLLKAKKKSLNASKRNDLLCYILFMVWPVLQFVVFYIIVNFNSFRLAFQSWTLVQPESGLPYYDVDNFTFSTFASLFDKSSIVNLVSQDALDMIWASVKSYLVMLCIGVPLGLFFSYYIYKALPGAKMFRVLLFLPSILSGVVMGRIFLSFFDAALPSIVYDFAKIFPEKLENAIQADIPDGYYSTNKYPMIMFYNVFIGFGTSVLMYSNKMVNSSPEISEAASLDGASGITEFWYITLPQVFPTLSLFLVTGVIGIFVNQFNLFTFIGWGVNVPANMKTLGFYLYLNAKDAQPMDYPALSALGLVLTAVAIPLTFGVKALLDKFGPSED